MSKYNSSAKQVNGIIPITAYNALNLSPAENGFLLDCMYMEQDLGNLPNHNGIIAKQLQVEKSEVSRLKRSLIEKGFLLKRGENLKVQACLGY